MSRNIVRVMDVVQWNKQFMHPNELKIVTIAEQLAELHSALHGNHNTDILMSASDELFQLAIQKMRERQLNTH